MKVSIIIPVFNVEPYIEKCLLSVVNQTYNNIEVLLIDDCGTDNSVAVAENFIRNLTDQKTFKLIYHEHNRGLSAARNTGIAHATGEYIYFLDSDDELIESCIEKLVSAAQIYKPDFLVADYKTSGASRLYPPLNLDEGIIDSNEIILRSYISRDWYMMAVNKLMKSVFILENDLYFKEGIVHEDDLWSFMVACKANSLYVLKDKTYIYVIRKGSITQSPTLHNLESRAKIISGMVHFVKGNLELAERKDIYNYVEELKTDYFFNILSSDTSAEFKYAFYKIIRENTYVTTKNLLKKHKLTLPQAIRNLHYILPTTVGYYYYRTGLKLKKSFRI